MKILFFIAGIGRGGRERRLNELIKVLIFKQDIEFELVIMSREVDFAEVFDLNIKIHYLIRKTKKDISVFRKFYKLCKCYQPDILHCWDSMTAVYSVPVCKLLKIKLVNGMVTDSPQLQNCFNKHWLRAKLTFPFSDVIVGNSKAGLAAYKAPLSKSVVIYNGFNFNRTNKLIKSTITRDQLGITTKYIVGMVANFSKYKDYKTYFSAAQILLKKRKDITFLALGWDTDSFKSRSLIHESNLDNFRLLGNRSDVEPLIQIMDICVLSTFTEGISNSILEYMALGKPVIATYGGGTDEIVMDHETGFLLNTSDPVELAEKVEILINNAQLRKKMGKFGKERIQKIFSIESMVDKYLSTYSNLLINKVD